MISVRVLVLLFSLALARAKPVEKGIAAEDNDKTSGTKGVAIRMRLAPDWHKCIDLIDGDLTNGNKLQLWDCNEQPNQNWIWDYEHHALRSGINPAKCVDFGDMHVKPSVWTPVMIWDCNGQPQQTLRYDGSTGAFMIGSYTKCLDAPAWGRETPPKNVVKLQVWDCFQPLDQSWTLQPYGISAPGAPGVHQVGAIRLRQALDWHKCIDLTGGDLTNGNKLQLWDCNEQQNQNWIWDYDHHALRSSVNPAKCVDLGDMQDGSPIMIWDCNGQPQQKLWYDGSTGVFFIAGDDPPSGYSKCIDSTPYKKRFHPPANGAKLQVWDCFQPMEQSWTLQSYGITVGLPAPRPATFVSV